jgi:hypothetical protein
MGKDFPDRILSSHFIWRVERLVIDKGDNPFIGRSTVIKIVEHLPNNTNFQLKKLIACNFRGLCGIFLQ